MDSRGKGRRGEEEKHLPDFLDHDRWSSVPTHRVSGVVCALSSGLPFIACFHSAGPNGREDVVISFSSKAKKNEHCCVEDSSPCPCLRDISEDTAHQVPRRVSICTLLSSYFKALLSRFQSSESSEHGDACMCVVLALAR